MSFDLDDLEREVIELMKPMPLEAFEDGMRRLAREAPDFFLEVFRLSVA